MNIKRTKIFWVVLLAASYLFIFSSSLAAEKYPIRPVELYIAYGPGGMQDIQSRILASFAYQYLGQPLVVVMKPGAGGIIGTAFVARAKPDGYTLLLGGPGVNSITCQIEDTGYTKDDFVPIAQISQSPCVVVIRENKPWKTLEDLLGYIRKNPEKVVFGVTAIRGQTGLSNTMLINIAGIKTSPATVPFKGVGDLNLALLRGDIDYTVSLTTPTIPFIRSKELRALAVLSDVRDPFLLDVPTAKELGYNVISNFWNSVLAPKGTPTEVVKTLSKAFASMVKDPSFVSLMNKSELSIAYKDGADFQKYWDDEYKRYGEPIEQLGLKKK